MDSRDFSENLLEASSYAVFIHNFREIINVNQTFLDLFGYKDKESVVGKKAIEMLVFHEDVKLVDEARERVKEGGPFFIPTIRLVKNDKSVFLAEAHIVTEVINEKLHLRVYARDITEAKYYESKLIESGKKYQTLFENSLDGIYKSTPDGRFVEVNTALVEMLGYSSAEELLAIDIKTDLYFDLKDRKIMPADVEDQYPLKRKDGSKIMVEDHSYYEYNDRGDIIFHHGILRDITSRLKEQKELENLLVLVEGQNDRLQNFAYIISHNIRSHSANLSSLAKFMKESKSEEEKESLISMLDNSAVKLEETIRNLNEVITLNQNLHGHWKLCNLKKEIEKSLEKLSQDIAENKVNVLLEVPPELEVRVVPSYLENILYNILTNAIRFRSKDVDSYIEIKEKNRKGYSVLEISDNGLGIDLKKNGNKLFRMYQKFHYNKDSRGFGLFLTKNQIESMNGKITVNSKPGEGSTFSIYFPVE